MSLPPPYVLKPIDEGSSVGVVIVKKGREHPPQEIARADWPCGEMLLAETFIAGRELTCAVMGDRVAGRDRDPGRLRRASTTTTRNTRKVVRSTSARLKFYQKFTSRSKSVSLTAHQAIGCRGVSRSDFRYDDESDTLVWLEVNTQPGMTETSLVPELAAHAGLNFGELVKWMVEDASLDR